MKTVSYFYFLFIFVCLPMDVDGSESSLITLDEMTVHVRMRSEQLQQIPISITHFSAENITDAHIDRVADFIHLTPNVNLSESQSIGTTFLTVRGISQVRNGEPPVATIVDGVLQVNSRQFNRELYDIESIDILRGPQSALYGRNAIGGAIIINTKKPNNDWHSQWRFGYGQADEYLTQGVVSGALIDDTLLLRLGGRYLEQAGYFNNNFLNKKVDFKEDIAFQAKLLWLATENLEFDLHLALNQHQAGGLNYHYQPAVIGRDGVRLNSNIGLPFNFNNQDANQVSQYFIANNLGKNERDMEEVSLKIEYLLDSATFTSITSWNQLEEFVSGDQFPYTASLTRDLGGGLLVDGGQTQYVDITAFSQEFRLTSLNDQNFRWMLGAYLLSTERFISSTTSDDKGFGLLQVERQPLSDERNPTLSFFGDDNDNTAWAVFANTAYDMTDMLEASFAWRYDEDRRRQTVSPFNSTGAPSTINQHTFSHFQPQASLRYQLLPDINIYGSWGIGFRSGQFNQNGLVTAAMAHNIRGIADITQQEQTENFEVGFKSQWLDQSMEISGSFFVTEQHNRPYFVFIGAVGGQALVNIDEVELMGGELVISNHWFAGLDSYLSLGYTSSHIEKYTLDQSLVGHYAPYIPEYTLNAGLQYRTSITSWLGFFGRIDFERLGKQYWDPENSTARSSLNLVNLKVGVESLQKKWSVMLMLDNATDETYNSEWVRGGFAYPALPRNWHVDFQLNF